MKPYKIFLFIFLLPLNLLFTQNNLSVEPITIFMIGNSTMADKPFKDGNPEKGWGQIFPLYFNEGVTIDNHAVNGRSTKSFIDEGRWDSVLNKIKPGNYVIIEFGHNDAKKDDPKRFADANTDYRKNLERFVDETIWKGGIPVLATPIVRRRFDEHGNFYDVHGDYPKVVRQVASEKNITLLDLHKTTEELVKSFGKEKSKRLFLHIQPGEYNSLPEGLTDDTHLSSEGAFKVCDLAVHEIREKIKSLASYLKN